MIIRYRNGKINDLILLISGNNIRFTIEHQLLNFSIFFFGFLYLISFPINHTSNLTTELDIANTITFAFLSILFYYSRKHIINFKAVITIYFLIFTISYISFWFLNGGLLSGTLYFYMAFLAYIIFITEKLIRFIFIISSLIIILCLILIEYYYPNLITKYPTRLSQFEDISISFFVSIFFTAILVYVGKELYKQEKKSTKDIIEQYRKQSKILKNSIEDKLDNLTFREKEVFQLIIEGKSNKEIADKLSLSLGSVKNHITSIYKKAEVEKRAELAKQFPSKKTNNL
jgi:DNA-binding CsgD family transcriptional regulator